MRTFVAPLTITLLCSGVLFVQAHKVSASKHQGGRLNAQCSHHPPCNHAAMCLRQSVEYAFKCNCSSNYKGSDCSTDVDECADGLHSCDSSARCRNTYGSYRCHCEKGYQGNGVHCRDINECQNMAAVCNKHANCTNMPGSFQCKCLHGYTGDGHSCQEILECASSPCQHGGTCEEKVNGYQCHCRAAFEGKHCEKRWLHKHVYKPIPERVVNLSTILGASLQELERKIETDLKEKIKPLSVKVQELSRMMDSSVKAIKRLSKKEKKTVSDLNKLTNRTKENRQDIQNLATFHQCKSETCKNGGQCRRMKVGFICQCNQFFTGTFCEALNSKSPASCKDYYQAGVQKSGQYLIRVDDTVREVWCNMTTDGGGWTVFQRRQDGSVDFYKGWSAYKNGFGNVSAEFWLGNRWLHALTSLGCHELRIDFHLPSGSKFAKYRKFFIAEEANNYQITISGFTGNVQDSLRQHNSMAFTTNDRDNDLFRYNCAKHFTGAWWYKGCFFSNLNGQYNRKDSKGMLWVGNGHPSFVEMKTRAFTAGCFP